MSESGKLFQDDNGRAQFVDAENGLSVQFILDLVRYGSDFKDVGLDNIVIVPFEYDGKLGLAVRITS